MIDGYNFYYWNVFMLVIYRLFIKDRKKFFMIVSFQLFLVLAVRSTEVGLDASRQYPQVYAGASDMTFVELVSKWSLIKQIILSNGWGGESGYVTLNWIFGHLLGLPYRVFIVFLSLLAAFAVYKYLERHSYSPLLGAISTYICLLECNAYFSALRRSTAMNFILFAFMAMEDKKYRKAVILLLIAITMHRSAMIIFLFLPFSKINITRELFRKIILLIVITTVFAIPIARNFLPILLKGFGKDSYFYGASGWLNSGVSLEVKAIAGFVALMAIYFCLDFKLLNTKYNRILCNIFMFVVVFSPIQAVVPLLGDIYMYFTPSIYLLIENLIVQRREDLFIKRLMWLVALLVISYILMQRAERYKNSPLLSYTYYRTIWTSHSGH